VGAFGRVWEEGGSVVGLFYWQQFDVQPLLR
jgi:hypothetical protein